MDRPLRYVPNPNREADIEERNRAMIALFGRITPAPRPETDEEWEAMHKAAARRLADMQASGQLVFHDARHATLRIDAPKTAT